MLIIPFSGFPYDIKAILLVFLREVYSLKVKDLKGTWWWFARHVL